MASALGLDFHKNLSLFSVPAAVVCALGPHIYALVSAGSAYDHDKPTELTSNIAKSDLDEETKGRLTRAHLATENGLQTLGVFAAAVVAANQAGVDPVTLNALTFGYVATRVLYNISYINLGGCKGWGGARSTAWDVSMGLCLTLWVKAGLKIYKNYVF